MSKIKKIIMAILMSICFLVSITLVAEQLVQASSKKPESMTLNASKKVIDINTTYKIKVKYTHPQNASKAVVYKSNNKKIATVSQKGIVKGKKEGTVKIIVQSKKNKKLKKIIKVTVKRLRPYSLKLSKSSVKIFEGLNYQLKASVKGKSGLIWKTSNHLVATVDKKGMVHAVGRGAATITVKTTKKGYEGKALSKTCYVRVIDESSTGGGITYGYNETPLYVCLYSDGEMVISSKAIKPEDGRKVIGNKKGTGPGALGKKLCSAIKTITFKEKVKLSTPCSFFAGLENLQKINNIEMLDVGNCKVFGYMFAGCSSLENIDINKLDTSKSVSMIHMFVGCKNLKTVAINKINTSNVKYMQSCFEGCESLKKIDLNGWNISNVKDISALFKGCNSLETVNVNNLDTSKVEDMREMFSGCSSLTSLDIKNFNTKKVDFMTALFEGCAKLETLDLSNLRTSNIWNMEFMFKGCKSLESLDLSNFDTTNVETMCGMFENCENLKELDLSSFNTKRDRCYIKMEDMFRNCNSLNLVKATKDTKSDICLASNSRAENIKNWIVVD